MQHIFMKFQELADSQWNAAVPYLPKPAKTGRPRADDRTAINAAKRNLEEDSVWFNQNSS